MRRWYEALLLMIAARIIDRNIQRSPVITRRDNNYLFEVEHELRAIAKRDSSEYSES